MWARLWGSFSDHSTNETLASHSALKSETSQCCTLPWSDVHANVTWALRDWRRPRKAEVWSQNDYFRVQSFPQVHTWTFLTHSAHSCVFWLATVFESCPGHWRASSMEFASFYLIRFSGCVFINHFGDDRAVPLRFNGTALGLSLFLFSWQYFQLTTDLLVNPELWKRRC